MNGAQLWDEKDGDTWQSVRDNKLIRLHKDGFN